MASDLFATATATLPFVALLEGIILAPSISHLRAKVPHDRAIRFRSTASCEMRLRLSGAIVAGALVPGADRLPPDEICNSYFDSSSYKHAL